MSALGNLMRSMAAVPNELANVALWLRMLVLEIREARRFEALKAMACPTTCSECSARATYVTHSEPAKDGTRYINGWRCAAHKTEACTPHGAAAFTDGLVSVARAQLRDPIEKDGAR